MSGPTLTNYEFDSVLDLPPWMGQQSISFRFQLINGVTGENRGYITPLRGGSLTHDTARTIKRQLTLNLGLDDAALINPISDRILLTMIDSSGRSWPLGRYMFTDRSITVTTAGDLANVVLNDEMFLVDQPITVGLDAGILGIDSAIAKTLAGLPIDYILAQSNFTSGQAWGIGTHRGAILSALAIAGDLFSPWFDNNGTMRFLRTFNPADQIPDFDFDAGNKVYRQGIVETSDLLTAPNRFIVISNLPNGSGEVVGTADVPANAPHSIPNRGFAITKVETIQLTNPSQATAVAQGMANRETVFERVTLTTAPDPRHDSYNVVKWRGELWLELAWSMSLVAGGGQTHLLRRGYRQG
jgi:hypothetical protein